MCLARMGTLGASGSRTQEILGAHGMAKSQPSLQGRPLTSPCLASEGGQLARFDWPPPPSPAAASRSRPTPLGRKIGAVGLADSIADDVEPNDASNASAAAEKRARTELWEVRTEIEKEKLRTVAPYPFFGCPMRFQDDHAALQISEDGRFSFSDAKLMESADADTSPSRKNGFTTRRVVTYEGVFTAPFTPPPEEDDLQATRRGLSPSSPKRPDTTRPVKTPRSPTRSELGSSMRAKDANTEDAQPSSTEVAGIEGSAMVKHEMIESGGKSRLVAVQRGAFRFAITVSPFFNPTFATVKVMVRDPSPGHPAPRGRRLPFVGAGPGGLKALGRASSVAGCAPAEMRPKRRSALGVPMKKSGRTGGILPSDSPLRCAAAGSLASPHGFSQLGGGGRRLSGSASTPQLRMPRPDSDWVDFYRDRPSPSIGQ